MTGDKDPGAETGRSWRVGDQVWRRQGPFLQRKAITRVTERGVFVDGRLAPDSSLTPLAAVDVPDSIRGLALEVEVYDYRVWRAYDTNRLSGMGRRGGVIGLYVEYSGCQEVTSRYFAGHGYRRPDVLGLLARLESENSAT